MSNSFTTGSDICFVLMPFGTKSNPFPGSVQIDFDRIFDEIIAPAIERAGLRALRADQEISGGLIHQAMFERLLSCEYAIADLTSVNPNVYYELGIRHAVRPWSTVLMCADKTRLPFDVEPLRALLYSLDDSRLSPKNAITDTDKLYQRLKAIKDGKSNGSVVDDSPLFELLKQHGYAGPDLSAFGPSLAGKASEYSEFKTQLSAARDLETLKRIESGLDALSDEHGPALVDLFMAYRQVMGWNEMVRLFDKIPVNLRSAVCVQEQYAMALGRLYDFDKAEEVLGKLIDTRGSSTLTYCFLGVVRKVRLLKARREGDELAAQGALDAAIEAFLAGFRIDPSVVFCGINAVLLMHARDPDDQRLTQIFPVVRYFVDTATSPPNGSFWNRAAELELAVLDEDHKRAMNALARLAVVPHEPWMPFSICANLQLLREERERRQEGKAWYHEIELAFSKSLMKAGDHKAIQEIDLLPGLKSESALGRAAGEA
jgi:hypothetical protein